MLLLSAFFVCEYVYVCAGHKLSTLNLYKFDKISEEFGVKPLDMWEIRNKNYIKEKIKAMKNREIFPFPDVKSLYRLKDIYGLSIVSDSPQEIVDFFIKEFGYKDLFECSVGRGTNLEDLEKMKPSPLALARLLENIQHEKLTYVGDSEKDHEFAEKTHMGFIFLCRKKDTDFNSLDKVVNHLFH